MGGIWVYRQHGQLFTQQVGAAVKPHGAGVCASAPGRKGADEQQQVGKKKFQALTLRGESEGVFNISTSRTLSTCVLSWTNNKSRFKDVFVKNTPPAFTVVRSHMSKLQPL